MKRGETREAKRTAPAMPKGRLRKISDLREDPRNSKKHPPSQIEDLRKSLRKYGQTKPVLLKGDDKTIGAGNGVFQAAKLEGWKEIWAVTHDLTDAEWKAYAILDNRLPQNGEWNVEILRQELAELHEDGIDLAGLGFTKTELSNFEVPGFIIEPQRITLGDPKFQVLITCKSEKDQEKMMDRFLKEGLDCKALSG